MDFTLASICQQNFHEIDHLDYLKFLCVLLKQYYLILDKLSLGL